MIRVRVRVIFFGIDEFTHSFSDSDYYFFFYMSFNDIVLNVLILKGSTFL